VDASRVADLSYTEGGLPAEGELVGTLSGKHVPEHQIVHLELSAMHKLLMIVLERLVVPCVLDS
jgi:hypothetical protein